MPRFDLYCTQAGHLSATNPAIPRISACLSVIDTNSLAGMTSADESTGLALNQTAAPDPSVAPLPGLGEASCVAPPPSVWSVSSVLSRAVSGR